MMAQQHTSLPPGIEICVAEAADYQAVMDIDKNIYNGTDYLPFKYMEYIKDPNRLCVLLKKDGRTIAFMISFIVDGGKTAIKQAGWVHADYQGQKYIVYLEYFASGLLAKSYNIERMAWTTTNEKASELVTKKESNIKMVVIRRRFSLDFSPMELDHTMKRPEFQNLQKTSQKYPTLTLTPSAVKDVMLAHPQDVAVMLPEGFWVVNWESFQPMPSNYDLITKNSTVFVTMATDGSLLALSFGTAMDVEVGLRYRADYYARPELLRDESLFVTHLLKHLFLIQQFYKGKKYSRVAFSIFYHQSTAETALNVKDMFKRKLGLDRKKTLEDSCILMFRKMLPMAQKSKL